MAAMSSVVRKSLTDAAVSRAPKGSPATAMDVLQPQGLRPQQQRLQRQPIHVPRGQGKDGIHPVPGRAKRQPSLLS